MLIVSIYTKDLILCYSLFTSNNSKQQNTKFVIKQITNQTASNLRNVQLWPFSDFYFIIFFFSFVPMKCILGERGKLWLFRMVKQYFNNYCIAVVKAYVRYWFHFRFIQTNLLEFQPKYFIFIHIRCIFSFFCFLFSLFSQLLYNIWRTWLKFNKTINFVSAMWACL